MDIPEFIEREPYEKGFSSFYNSRIRELVGRIQSEREGKLAIFRTRRNSFGPIFIGLLILSILTDIFLVHDFFVTSYCLYFDTLLAFWIVYPLLNFKGTIKTEFLPLICEFYDGLKYELKPGPYAEDISKLEIFLKFQL